MLQISKDKKNLATYVYDDMKADGRPVVVYGAGEIGMIVVKLLREHGIKPYAFAVDRPYYQDDMLIDVLLVVCYEDLVTESDRFIFILGIGKPHELVRSFLEDTRGTHLTVAMPYGEFAPMDYAFCKQHEEKLQETYAWLSDGLSRKTMQAYIDMKLTGDIRYNFDVFVLDQYFNDITVFVRGGRFVDCGAFDGDTVEEYIRWSEGTCKGIVALEPDAQNYEQLKKRVSSYQFPIETYPVGVWSEADTLHFQIDGWQSTHVDARGGTDVRVEALDHLLSQGADMIKMDIEGSEMHALTGAQETIRRYHPVLAVSVYHKSEDLITIPQYIKSLETENVKYRLYLRKHSIFRELELVLYAVPENR